MRRLVRGVVLVLAIVASAGAAHAEDGLKALSEKNRKGKSVDELVGSLDASELEAIKKQADSAPASVLFLGTLTKLTPDQAKELAGSGAQVAVLNDLATIDDPVAVELAKWPGQTLVMNGLKTLPGEASRKLRAWPGKKIFLDGLPALEEAAAKDLSTWAGELLSLRGMKSFDPKTAEALSSFKGKVMISIGSGEKKTPVRKISPEELRRVDQAIVRGDVVTVRKYLDGGGNPDASEHGTTLLMEACSFKQLEIAKALVAKGADVNARSDDHHTPLMFAIEYPEFASVPVPKKPEVVLELVTFLLDSKADPNPKKAENPGRDAMWGYAPPLTRAAESGDVAVASLLLARGAEVNATDYRGYPPLIAAINKNKPAVVAKLLAAGAEVNPKDPPRAGIPLLQAVSMRGMDIEMFAYEATTKGGAPDPEQLKAKEKEAIDLIDTLLEAGANMEASDESGRTALTAALNAGIAALVEELLAKGAKLDAKDPKGNTPLHFAAGNGRLKEEAILPLVDLLVKKGADKSAKNADGLTPAQVAQKRGFPKVAAALGN